MNLQDLNLREVGNKRQERLLRPVNDAVASLDTVALQALLTDQIPVLLTDEAFGAIVNELIRRLRNAD